MDDLDSLFEGELASINQVFQAFEIKDKKTEKRNLTEQEDLEKVPQARMEVVDFAPTLDILQEVQKRRSRESMSIEHQWEEEMLALEQERLKEQEHLKELEMKRRSRVEQEDDLIQNLDNELKSLIQDKEEEAKHAHREKLLRAEREKGEKERKEKERLEKIANTDNVQELTVEEWIQWMESKRKQEMTPEQLEDYLQKKKLRQEKERERAERIKQEEDEKKRKTRDRMDNEMKSYRQRQLEVVESRLTEEELQQKQEEMAQRQLEESRVRKERGDKMRQEDKDKEIESLKPKARSALAARWEESVKAHSNGKVVSRALHKATVLTGGASEEQSTMEKEEERLIRRISGGYPKGGVNLSPEKRRSIQ